MRGVQDSSPKDPDPLALHIEEWAPLQPPCIGLRCEEVEPVARQLQQPEREYLGSLLDRKHARRIRLGAAEKLTEKPAFGEKLMPEYVKHRAGAGMRAKGKIARLELPQHRRGLVGLARVGLKRMLQQGVPRERNFGFDDHTS